MISGYPSATTRSPSGASAGRRKRPGPSSAASAPEARSHHVDHAAAVPLDRSELGIHAEIHPAADDRRQPVARDVHVPRDARRPEVVGDGPSRPSPACGDRRGYPRPGCSRARPPMAPRPTPEAKSVPDTRMGADARCGQVEHADLEPRDDGVHQRAAHAGVTVGAERSDEGELRRAEPAEIGDGLVGRLARDRVRRPHEPLRRVPGSKPGATADRLDDRLGGIGGVPGFDEGQASVLRLHRVLDGVHRVAAERGEVADQPALRRRPSAGSSARHTSWSRRVDCWAE